MLILVFWCVGLSEEGISLSQQAKGGTLLGRNKKGSSHVRTSYWKATCDILNQQGELTSFRTGRQVLPVLCFVESMYYRLYFDSISRIS